MEADAAEPELSQAFRGVRRLLLASSLAEAAFGLAFPFLGIRIVWNSVLGTLACIFVLGVALYIYRKRRRSAPIQTTIEAVLWAFALSNLFILPMYVLVRLPIALHDDWLARADAAFGLDVHVLTTVVRGHATWPLDALTFAYESLTLFSVLGLALPALMKRADAVRDLLVALVIGIWTSLAVLLVLQAIGPWVLSGARPLGAQRELEAAIHALKAGKPAPIDWSSPDPLIAFPSWHAELATISALTFARIPRLRWPGLVWGLLIVLSTWTTGWHYFWDTIGGVAFASGALLLARRIGRKVDAAQA